MNYALFRNDSARAVVRALFEQREGFFDHLAAVVHFLFVRKRRVAEDVEDAVAAKDSVRAYAFGDFRKVRDVDDGDSRALYFFGHHCAAA